MRQARRRARDFPLHPDPARKRAEFVRMVIRKAILETEEARTRRGYQGHPDAESGTDNWSNAEKWQA